MKRLAVILAGSTLAMSGYAANWLEVSKSQTGSVFSLDVDSIERSDIHIIDEKEVENITVSIRRTYPAPKDSAKDAKENEAKAKESKDKGAKVLKSWQSDKPILTTKDFKLTKPKTISRLLVEQACKSYQQAK